MARISGVDLPREKRVEAALPYIYGIGLHTSQVLLERTGINPDTRVRDLTVGATVADKDIVLAIVDGTDTSGIDTPGQAASGQRGRR